MSREEAIKNIQFILNHLNKDSKTAQSFVVAIEALSQKPCEDAISRQVIKEQMIKYGFNAPDMTVTEFVEDLPPVNPQEIELKYCDRNICIKNEYNGISCDECEVTKSQEQKEGHWIKHPNGIYAHLVCDKCLSTAPYNCRTNYCPNCGAKMVEPQERSDKECLLR